MRLLKKIDVVELLLLVVFVVLASVAVYIPYCK